MRCLASIVHSRIDPDELVDVPADKLIEGMTTLKQAMFGAIDFLEKELKIKNIVFLPFPIMIVPLVYFFSKTLKPNLTQLSALRRWFWSCAFTQRYKNGTNTYVMEDIQRMTRLAAGDSEFDFTGTTIAPDIFKKAWRINSTSAKATICLLAQLEPKSLLTGKNVDLGTTMSAYNAREFHHIYPKAFLATLGIAFHESNVIANICLLTSNDNKIISDQNPADYFSQISSDQIDTIFSSACIPISLKTGTKPYTEFLNIRALALSEVATNLVTKGHP